MPEGPDTPEHRESTPALSVVIPHYGDPAPTAALADALACESSDIEVEVIVVDDCSPTPFPDTPGYIVHRRSSNGGFGSAVNTGVAVARGRHLLIINSDAHVPNGFLSSMAQLAAAHPGAVIGPAIVDDGLGQVTAWKWPSVLGLVAEWLEPLARFHGDSRLDRLLGADVAAYEARQATEVDWMVGACLLIPRDQFDAVGGFDEGFFMNCEEIDLQRRLRERGVRSIYVPALTVTHTAGGSSDPARKSGWLVDARFRYHHKWGGATALLVGLSSATLLNFVWNAGRRLFGRSVHPFRTLCRQSGLIRHGWEFRKAATPR